MTRLLLAVWCWFAGHDWFNGGEHCRDCGKPRPEGWKPEGWDGAERRAPLLLLAVLLLAGCYGENK
jgi:hypothetical protein